MTIVKRKSLIKRLIRSFSLEASRHPFYHTFTKLYLIRSYVNTTILVSPVEQIKLDLHMFVLLGNDNMVTVLFSNLCFLSSQLQASSKASAHLLLWINLVVTSPLPLVWGRILGELSSILNEFRVSWYIFSEDFRYLYALLEFSYHTYDTLGYSGDKQYQFGNFLKCNTGLSQLRKG